MAQLVKLYDYISRYEWNIYRYPTQFIRLKQENWKNLYDQWLDKYEIKLDEDKAPESLFKRLPWKFLSGKEKEMESDKIVKERNGLPKTEEELKRFFLKRLFPFQLKWAASTITNVSLVDEKIYKDSILTYFLQRFPDIYFLLYFPVFAVKNAPVDGEIILISPLGIEIIYVLETNPEALFMADEQRHWTIYQDGQQSRIVSPIISLKRTEQIVKGILKGAQVNFPVRKLVLSRTNHIVYSQEPYNTHIVGKNDYKDWFIQCRSLATPLKNQQLKATEAILKHCQSVSIKRPEWEEETDSFSLTDEG